MYDEKEGLIATVLFTTLILGACGNVGASNETTEKNIQSSQQTETVDTSAKSEEKHESESAETEKFVAQGKTTLMNFLSAASDNGYEITNPERGEIYITATAKGSEAEYEVKYMVENQKVYSVSVYSDSIEKITEDTFLNCVYAMAKAINPDIAEDTLKEAVDEAIATPDKEIVNEDTMFRYNSEDIDCTISY